MLPKRNNKKLEIVFILSFELKNWSKKNFLFCVGCTSSSSTSKSNGSRGWSCKRSSCQGCCCRRWTKSLNPPERSCFGSWTIKFCSSIKIPPGNAYFFQKTDLMLMLTSFRLWVQFHQNKVRQLFSHFPWIRCVLEWKK